MAVLSAEKIARELCKEWGIDPDKVTGITIELSPTSVAAATIRYCLDSTEVTILKTYKLVERESE